MLAVVPLLVNPILPLIDLPNHIARQYVAYNLAALPQLQKFYEYHWELVPNLSMDVFVQALARLIGVAAACRLYCITCAALVYFGTVALSRTLHGRYIVLPMVAGLLIYNGAFLFGFVSYVCGVGLSLFAAAAWIRWRQWRLAPHMAVFVACAILLASAHLFAFGLFGLFVLGFELSLIARAFLQSRAQGLRQVVSALVRGAPPALVPLVLLAAVSPTVAGVQRNVASSIWWKLEALSASLIFYLTTAEIIIAAGVVIVLSTAFAFRVVRLDAVAAPSLVLMAVIFAAMPRTLLSSGYADYRMPSAIVFFALASVGWGSRATVQSRTLVAGALLILVALKSVYTTVLWRSWQPELAEYDRVLGQLPTGAVLLVLQGSTGSASLDRRPPVVHMAAGAVRQQAFVPFLFGDEPGILLKTQPAYLDLRYLAPASSVPAVIVERLPRFTHLLVERPAFVGLPAGIHLQLLAEAQHLQLFELTDR